LTVPIWISSPLVCSASSTARRIDSATASVVVTIVGGPLYYRLRAAGLSEDETVAVELSLVLPWLESQSG
jgi:hypothetical protein